MSPNRQSLLRAIVIALVLQVIALVVFFSSGDEPSGLARAIGIAVEWPSIAWVTYFPMTKAIPEWLGDTLFCLISWTVWVGILLGGEWLVRRVRRRTHG